MTDSGKAFKQENHRWLRKEFVNKNHSYQVYKNWEAENIENKTENHNRKLKFTKNRNNITENYWN